MEFTSLTFGLFVLVVLALYWSVSARSQRWILLLASLVFYFSWGSQLGWLILLTTIVTFGAAILIESRPAAKRSIAAATIAVVLGVLFICKYGSFFGATLNSGLRLFSVGLSGPIWQFAIPLGISFYTFQVIGYLIDVYRGKVAAERNFVTYSLFVLFFPKLIAGPIERSTSLLPQLQSTKVFSSDRIVSGLQLFVWGAFKKIVIADNLKLVVDPVFENLPEYRGLSLVLTVFFYSWQIYADFSGYTDMARGLSRLFGIELLENFKQPYFATSVGDFWRRWHISLSSWLREYLYFPLGGSRVGLLRTCLNILIVFVLCGLWHGAAWTFVVWGGVHGLVLIGERIGQLVVKKRFKVPPLVGMIYTYGLICISWVFFRASTLNDALYVLRNSFVGISNIYRWDYIQATFSQLFTTNVLEISIALFCVVCILLMDVFRSQPKLRSSFNSMPVLGRYTLYIAAVLIILILRNADYTPFVYVQF